MGVTIFNICSNNSVAIKVIIHNLKPPANGCRMRKLFRSMWLREREKRIDGGLVISKENAVITTYLHNVPRDAAPIVGELGM